MQNEQLIRKPPRSSSIKMLKNKPNHELAIKNKMESPSTISMFNITQTLITWDFVSLYLFGFETEAISYIILVRPKWCDFEHDM